MKTRSNSTSMAIKTPAEQFINTVTNFNSNFGVSGHHHGHLRKNSSGYTTPHNSDPTEASRTAIPLTNFLKIYFESVYFLLVCPFRIVLNDNGKFAIKKCRPQTVLCAVMQLMCFIRLMTQVRVSIDNEYSCKNASKNPVQYFSIILEVSSLIFKLITIKRFWFNQADYLNILNYIQGKSILRVKPSSVKFYQTVFFLRLFFCLIAVHAFTSFIMGKSFIDESYSWSPSLWSNQLIKMARFTFCVDKNFNIRDITPPTTITALDIFITVLMSISLIQRFFFGSFCDLLLLSHTVTLWMAAKSFSTTLQRNIRTLQVDASEDFLRSGGQSSNSDYDKSKVVNDDRYGGSDDEGSRGLRWADVYSRFRVVEKLAIAVNIALGSQLTWYMAEGVMYYSVNLDKFLTSANVFVRVSLTISYCITFGILFVSADICSQMENVKVWISFRENRKNVPADEFSIVLHEMIAKDIGIRGSNVFTITYSLLAVFFSTIVTYFIICVQQGGDSITILEAREGNATRC